MTCPLCGARKARRLCPALGQQICPVCCGTKRLVEIRCPSDCVYLAASREHPAAALVRRQQEDLRTLARHLRDLNQRQAELFLLLSSQLGRFQAPELIPLVDEDVALATTALAATMETSARGIIYDHRPPSAAAERLAHFLKQRLVEAGQGQAGSAHERDAAVVLRRIAEAVAEARAGADADPRAYLQFIGRILKPAEKGSGDREALAEAPDQDRPRLIVP